MRVIAIANEKGGVGKTTTAINLSAALVKLGYKVLVIDMDAQMNSTAGLSTDNHSIYTSYHLVKKEKEAAKPDNAILKTKWKNLYIIPASEDLSGLDIELADPSIICRESLLKRTMRNMRSEFDFVFIDAPPSLSLVTINIFTYAKEVLVPCQTHPFSFAALDKLFETISSIKEADLNASLQVTGILPTFFDPRTRASRKIIEQLNMEKYRMLVFNTFIRTNTTIAESNDVSMPVIFYDEKCRGSEDYMSLANEILKGKHGS